MWTGRRGTADHDAVDQRWQGLGTGRLERSGLTLLLDSHLHVVSPDGARHPRAPVGLPGDSWATTRPASVDVLAADLVSAGVGGGVLVQAVGAYGYDNSYIVEAAERFDQFVAQVVVDHTSSDRVADLHRWATRGAGGVRLFDIPAADPRWLGVPGFEEVVEVCLDLGLRIACCVLPDGLDDVARVLDLVAGRAPVVLDHCGFVDLDTGGLVTLARLADRGDLVCKVTSHVLAGLVDPAATVARLVAAFGADHVCWGSDHPQHEGSYADKVALVSRAADDLTCDQRAMFLAGTTANLWPELVR